MHSPAVGRPESLDDEARYWESLDWQRMPKQRRLSEWDRHLHDLGLSLEWINGQRLIDIGCGPTGLVYFAEGAAHRVGLDPLADVYERWNGYFGTPIDLRQGYGERISCETGSFDVAACINCLDHVRDPAQVLAEIARVLRPGGNLLLHTDLDSPLRKLHKRLRPRAGRMHPQSLTYDWLMHELSGHFVVRAHTRDSEAFRATRQQMRYEAYWDGLVFRATRSRAWMNHIWLRAERRER